MTLQQITVATTVPMPPARAWALFTQPASITQWNFASDDWHCPSASVDLVVGGTHKAQMAARDGSFSFDFEGIYTEVLEPQALTLLLGDGRRSRTTFAPVADGTLVQTSFDPETENSLELQRDGWQAILDNYRKYAERQAAA
jgi:uncharacterized protein YndB with AHSA1/START domain